MPKLLPPNNGPHPAYIQVAKPYVFEQEIQECMKQNGTTETKEDGKRLQGVAWIDSVRRALQLPIRTYNTACVYYHKFRLIHQDGEYDFRDAAAAALFNACKIEDTLKKSRDILCAAYNLKLPQAEHLSSDDALFEAHSKTILGLERLMLEASGFDFRNRYPQKILMKLVRSCSLNEHVGAAAYKIALDMYRTFIPLKQSTQTMALATLELAIRICDVDMSTVKSEHGFDYERWATTRPEIMETLLDMLDLYTIHRAATLIGPDYALDTFINIRIQLNQEATEHKYPRYTEWQDPKPAPPPPPPVEEKKKTGIRLANGKIIATKTSPPPSPKSPVPNPAPSQSVAPSERQKDSTVRFMLDPERAKDETVMIKDFFRLEEVEEEYYVDILQHNSQKKNKATHDPLLQRLAAQYLASADSNTQPIPTAPLSVQRPAPPTRYRPLSNTNMTPIPTGPRQMRLGQPTAPRSTQSAGQSSHSISHVSHVHQQTSPHGTKSLHESSLTAATSSVKVSPPRTEDPVYLSPPPAPSAELWWSSPMKISPLDDTRMMDGDCADVGKVKELNQASDKNGNGANTKDVSEKKKWTWAEERGW